LEDPSFAVAIKTIRVRLKEAPRKKESGASNNPSNNTVTNNHSNKTNDSNNPAESATNYNPPRIICRADRKMQRRIVEEIRLMGLLSGHPNVLQIYEFFTEKFEGAEKGSESESADEASGGNDNLL
jgi:hypothetical protein